MSKKIINSLKKIKRNQIVHKNLNKNEINLAFVEIIDVYENGKDPETVKLNDKIKKKLYSDLGIKYNFLFSKQYLKSLNLNLI